MKYTKILFFILAIFSFNAYAEEKISIIGDPWCPYNCKSDDKQPGFMIEAAQEIFKKAGISVDYQNIPWARAIKDTRETKYNAIVGAYKEDAPDFIFPEEPVTQSNDGFYVKKGNPSHWHYTDLNSLEKVSAGVILDYSYGKKLDDYIKEHAKDPTKIQYSSGDDALAINVKKLLAGRLQTVIEDRKVMQTFLAKTAQNNVVEEAGNQEGEVVYIAFSPKNPESARYAKLFSDGIKEMKKSGHLKEIMMHYNIEQ